MRRLLPCLTARVALACVGIGSVFLHAPVLRGADADQGSLALDRLEIAGRAPCEGLIESEDTAWITMIEVRRPPGKPMYLVVRPIDRHSVTRIVRLDAQQREKLRREIDRFRNRAAIETGRMEAVVLASREAEGMRYQHYQGKWFSLDSTADETTTRRLIVRTEQVFAAYRQILPPRTEPPSPPRLVIFRSMAEYQDWLARRKVKIQNPACFLEEPNIVAASSELGRLIESLQKNTARNRQLQQDIKGLEDRLADRLRTMAERLKKDGVAARETRRLLTLERTKFEGQTRSLREELTRSERASDSVFLQATRQMFARLYHESFHAYLENYVYPHRQYDVPFWLNEGLAVMFEGGMLEGGTLRVDAPNMAVLKKLREDLSGSQPLALASLLTAGPRAFLPAHRSEVAEADRRYAHAWGVAYFLCFQQHLLGSPALDGYVRRQDVADATGRFEQLVGRPLEVFERQWREYITSLRMP